MCDHTPDFHVARLHYEIRSTHDGTVYENPERMEFTTSLGHFVAADGALVAEPLDHFATEAEAREAIERFLRAWEIDTDLASSPGTIRFVFVNSDIIDRNPAPSGPRIAAAIFTAAGAATVTGYAATLMVSRRRYPTPPAGFEANDFVRHAHERWLEYKRGREPIPGAAYFILTILEGAAGGRRDAAREFNIDEDVLRTIGRLVSQKGDVTSARKASGLDPLTASETAWLEQAVLMMIKRLGQHAAGANLQQITFSDLPSLP